MEHPFELSMKMPVPTCQTTAEDVHAVVCQKQVGKAWKQMRSPPPAHLTPEVPTCLCRRQDWSDGERSSNQDLAQLEECDLTPMILIIDLLMGLFRGAVFRHGGGDRKQPIKQPTEMPTSTMALMGRFPSLMGRFPTLMGRFTDFVLRGRFTS